MATAGVEWIQIRAKRMADRELVDEIEVALRSVDRSRTLLWIDDRADLAAAFGLALHIGQRDLPVDAARRVVGTKTLLGLSTHDEGQLLDADRNADVDLIAVGPVFATASKEAPDPVVGLDFVRRARARTAKPLVAIGGLDPERLAAALAAGADAGAVLGDLCRGDLAGNLDRYSGWLGGQE